MSKVRRAAIGKALECCARENPDCNSCPYLGGPCDMPYVEYVTLPVHLLSDIRAEMYEPDSPWENDPAGWNSVS